MAVKISGGGDFDGAILQDAATESTLADLARAMGVVVKHTENLKNGVVPTDDAKGIIESIGSAAKKTFGAGAGIAVSALEAVGGAAGNLATGQYELTDMTQVLATTLKGTDTGFTALDKALGGAGTGLHKATEFIQETAGSFRQLSSVGAGLDGDFTELRRVAANTRMPLDKFTEMVGDNAERLNALGTGVNGGTRAFGQLSKQMYDSRMGAELQALGVGFEESNELLLDYMEGRRREIDFSKLNAEQQRAQIKSAQAYIYELDTIARITGKNRKELQEEARAKAREGQNLAALRLLEMEGVEGATQNFKEMSANISGKMGPGFNDMFASMIRLGGAIDATDETQRALAGGMPEVTDLMRKAALALRDGNNSAALEYQKQAEAAMIDAQNDPNKLRIMALGDNAGAVGKAMADQLAATQDFQDAVNRQTEAMGLTTDSAANAAAAIEALGKAAREGQQATVSAPTNQAVVAAETAIRDAGSAMFNTIDSDFKPAIQNAAAVVAEAFGSISPQDMQNFTDNLASAAGGIQGPINKLREMAENTEQFTDTERENYAHIANELENTKNIIQDVGSSAKEVEEARLKQFNLLNSMSSDLDNYSPKGADSGSAIEDKSWWDSFKETISNILPFNAGTLGETGSLFKDFGEGQLAMLHGLEAVVTPDQMKGILASNLKNQLQKPASSMSSAPAATASSSATASASPQEGRDTMVEMLNTKLTELTEINKRQFATLERQLKVSRGMSGDVYKGVG